MPFLGSIKATKASGKPASNTKATVDGRFSTCAGRDAKTCAASSASPSSGLFFKKTINPSINCFMDPLSCSLLAMTSHNRSPPGPINNFLQTSRTKDCFRLCPGKENEGTVEIIFGRAVPKPASTSSTCASSKEHKIATHSAAQFWALRESSSVSLSAFFKTPTKLEATEGSISSRALTRGACPGIFGVHIDFMVTHALALTVPSPTESN